MSEARKYTVKILVKYIKMDGNGFNKTFTRTDCKIY